MRITVLAGGIGAARFLRGLLAAAPDATITVIGNTADDITLFGLRVCRTCEVRAECLEYALENDERFGSWGGLSERERRRIKREVV